MKVGVRWEVQPSFAEVKDAFDAGRVAPVWTELLADGVTPLVAYATLGGGTGSFLLESVEGGETWGRYSFVGFDPRMIARIDARGLEVWSPRGGVTRAPGEPWAALRELLGNQRAADVPEDFPRFWGGAVGYVSYEAVRRFEPTAIARARARGGPPDAELAIGGTVLAFDARRQTVRVIAPVIPEGLTSGRRGPRAAKAAYDDACKRIERAVAKLRLPARLAPMLPPVRGAAGGVSAKSSFDRAGFLAAVERAKEHIRAGDAIQVVLSQRFRSSRGRTRVLDVYRALRALNPSPYMFLVELGERALAGASPETMVRVDRGVVTVRPIAGTRPRGRSAEEDARLADELLADPKERAEHVMLVDLGRNDLGRISEVGSVRVPERMVIERYSHVMHIVSSVTGKLAEGRDALDVLAATFPAGTLSGAPKVRAMQIIDELEPVPRGIYGGAVGYIGFDGNMDVAIAIRTVEANARSFEVQAGAGIVEASDPETEHQETLHKARAPLEAIAHANIASRPRRKPKAATR
ncbi:MAG: chorismate-binding protein [Deltaproteobacteria bacterium]|nr:chorismate-binding protein [Deltaproteobacteria bacterium]